MIQLRHYQQSGVDSLWNYLHNNKKGDPLVVMPTATGKAFTICEFISRAIKQYPDTKVVNVTHTKELVEQNAKSMMQLAPGADIGIYSSGLGVKKHDNQIIFGGVQSMFRKPELFGKIGLFIVDECHLMSKNQQGMYGKLIEGLREINPKMRVIGFTATPYRTDSGMLAEGRGAVFSEVCYEYNIAEAVQDGYLTQIRPKRMENTYNVAGVKKSGGDFQQKDLAEAVDKDDLNKAVVTEMLSLAKDRQCWMVFAASIEHADHINQLLKAEGVASEMITGDTPNKQRERYINMHKTGRLRCLVNVGVLTTGFDNPKVDMIACLRPTESAGLWVQIAGRGMRLFSGSIGNLPTKEDRLQAIADTIKQDCLVLDFAGNTRRHGPIDMIKGKSKKEGKGEGEAPIKTCPQCAEIVFAGAKICPSCEYEFPANEIDIQKEAGSDELLSINIKPDPVIVTKIQYSVHTSAKGNNTLRVDYYNGFDRYSEWISMKHPTGRVWWNNRLPHEPIPTTPEESFLRSGDLPVPYLIFVKQVGKYLKVLDYKFPEEGEDFDVQVINEAPVERFFSAETFDSVDNLDDLIPF